MPQIFTLTDRFEKIWKLLHFIRSGSLPMFSSRFDN